MGILDRILGGSPERQVMERGKNIIDNAVESNKLLIRIINGYNSLDEAHEIKRASAREVFEITNSVTSGAIAPNIIDDMIRLANREDYIIDSIFNLSRALVRYRPTNSAVGDYVNAKLLELSQLINSALVLLYEMHKAQTTAEARSLRLKIEEIEQKGDEIKDGLLDYAYKSKDLDFRSFYYVQNVAYLADDVLDGCEDASDMIVSIMRSVLT